MAKVLSNQQITPLPNQQITPPSENEPRGPRLVDSTKPSSASTEVGRRTGEKVSEWKQVIEEKVADLSERSAQTMDEVRQSASEAYEQAKAKASSTLEQARTASAEVAKQARVRARDVIENYPLHVLAGVAGVALIAGVLLRIWRSSRYE
jgi:ElaB/YqjD/DUF883 family membrane-anchored ribosome-binding protein